MSENISIPEGGPVIPVKRRSPWIQAGINALIAAVAVMLLGTFIAVVLHRGDPETMGELTVTISSHVAWTVYIFSIFWLKLGRIFALLFLAVMTTFIVAGVKHINKAEESGLLTFCEAARGNAETVTTGENTKIVHEGLGIEITVPHRHLDSIPIVNSDSKNYLWGFSNPESGSSFIIGASYAKLSSGDDLENFISGMLDAYSAEAAFSDFDFTVISIVVSEETMTGLAECTMSGMPVIIRVIYVDEDNPGLHSVISAQAFSLDRDLAWSAAYSLFASRPSKWGKEDD